MTTQLLMGNEAFAHAALAAGVRVVAGYPGTPSSEVIETIAREHAAGRAKGVHVEWSTNEKVALELLAGASLTGARCLFTAKQVGLNVASDALLSLNYVGIKGGLVLFVADDPGPISSQTEQDTRRFASFAKVPVLDPSTIEQGYDMMKQAFELSEAYETPVIMRSSTRICHASAFMEVPENTHAREGEGFERSSRWVIFPRRAYEAHGEINERLKHIAADYCDPPYESFNPRETFGASDGSNKDASSRTAPRKALLAGGVSASYVREALSMLEERCKMIGIAQPSCEFMQIGTPFPFPEKRVEHFVAAIDEVLVLEELDHVLEDELLKLCGKLHAGYKVYGKLTGHTLDRGENTIDGIFQTIVDYFGLTEDFNKYDAAHAKEAGKTQEPPQAPTLPIRPPVLCAGCPHRGSFYAVKRALKQMKQDAVFCGDIGCYTLGNAQPLDAVDTCLCMGAGISMAQGFSVVEQGKKQLAFVGDSTFFASGLPGLVNAIYNDHDITLIVLDNSITAMTGAQPHPGTGVTLMGQTHQGISIEAVLKAIGFEHVEQANPFDLEESIAVAKSAIAVEGPSALIYEAPCITLVKPEAAVLINDDTCTGCKKCITEIGCPAIGFDKDKKIAFINDDLCYGCDLCIAVCPFDVISSGGDGHA